MARKPKPESRKTYEELLKDLKRIRFDRSILSTLDYYDLDLITVWQRVTRRHPPKPFGNIYVHDAWNHVEFDVRIWADISGVVEDIIWERWQKLANGLLIYPDGTFPEEVKDLLANRTEWVRDVKQREKERKK